MGAANAVIDTLSDYQQVLNQHPLVIVLFTSQSCQACLGVHPRFNSIAEKYAGRVMSLLDRLPRVGDSLEHEGWHLTVAAVEERRVTQVLLVPRARSL